MKKIVQQQTEAEVVDQGGGGERGTVRGDLRSSSRELQESERLQRQLILAKISCIHYI